MNHYGLGGGGTQTLVVRPLKKTLYKNFFICVFPRSGVGLPTKSENKEKVTECIFHVLQNENMFQSGEEGEINAALKQPLRNRQRDHFLREAAKNVLLLMARPLRPNPPLTLELSGR